MQNSFVENITDFKRIIKIVSPGRRLQAFWLFALMVGYSLTELLFINSLSDMGLALSAAGSLRGNFLYKWLFTIEPISAWANDDRRITLIAGIMVILFCGIKNFVSYLMARKTALLGEDISIDIGHEIMERFLYRDYAWHLSPESSNMFQRMMWRSTLAQMLIVVLTIYSCAVTVTILFFSLLTQETELTAMVIVVTSLVGGLLFKFMKRSVDHNAKISAECSTNENKVILCITRGIRDVIIYRKQDVFLDSVVDVAQKGRIPHMVAAIAPTVPTWALESLGFLLVIASIAYLVLVENADKARIISAMSLLLITAWRVLPFCNRIVGCQVQNRGLRPMALQVLEQLESLRGSVSQAPQLPAPDFRFEKDIKLVDVCFRYPCSETDSLHRVNLHIAKGEKVGLIGPSGAGKSTLVGVLCGLLPPSNGEIRVDGRCMTESQASAFTNLIGFVPQAPFLFSGTLAENVAFSDWGKNIDETKVRDACKKAAVDFVDQHPQGIFMHIGENGGGLSGGQAQRVSIARALYPNPTILIFDEATSALDQGNESAIMETINSMSTGITCIIIAHRLTTVEGCDKLIWVEDGCVREVGSPQTVLPKYTQTYQNQMQENAAPCA